MARWARSGWSKSWNGLSTPQRSSASSPTTGPERSCPSAATSATTITAARWRRSTYEGHPSAEAVLKDVAQEIDSRFDLISLAVAHRVGPLAIGDAALVAVVASAHREEAFRACAALVDLTKERLPVWKHQVFTDGTDEWVNCA